MATINYKDTKQFLSFVIKGRLFWGEECKKRKAEGKYLMSTRKLGSMVQPRMLVGIRNLRSLRNIGREHIATIYQNSPPP